MSGDIEIKSHAELEQTIGDIDTVNGTVPAQADESGQLADETSSACGSGGSVQDAYTELLASLGAEVTGAAAVAAHSHEQLCSTSQGLHTCQTGFKSIDEDKAGAVQTIGSLKERP